MLAKALAVNTSLKKLIVSSNNIGDNGIVHIAKALKMKNTLEEVNIREYSLTEVEWSHLPNIFQ